MDIMDIEVLPAFNEFLEILADLGCDTYTVPVTQGEIAILWVRYSWAVFLVGIGVKSMIKLIAAFASGGKGL